VTRPVTAGVLAPRDGAAADATASP